MQLRPLHMLVVKGSGSGSRPKLPTLNGHCVDGNRTRVTITSNTDPDGSVVWQVGGQIAEDGVEMTPEALIAHGKKELLAVLPSLELAGLQWTTYRVDRAEGNTRDIGISGAGSSGGGSSGGGRGKSKRPEDPVVLSEGNVITGWPTKLVLAPKLAEMVLRHLDPPTQDPHPGLSSFADWPHPGVAKPPWETDTTWYEID